VSAPTTPFLDGGAPTRDEPLPIELANSNYAVAGEPRDGLLVPGNLAAWLRAQRDRFDVRLPDSVLGSITDGQLRAYRRLRAATYRMLLAAMNDTAPVPADVTTVNRESRTSPPWPMLVWTADELPSTRLVSTGDPVAEALAEIARDLVRLLCGPDRELVRACRAPGCVLFYLKNHPRREWCSAACGNRARVARHYERHHGQKKASAND
jgi:predicted RNA-binding Zn ribbon-like protein